MLYLFNLKRREKLPKPTKKKKTQTIKTHINSTFTSDTTSPFSSGREHTDASSRFSGKRCGAAPAPAGATSPFPKPCSLPAPGLLPPLGSSAGNQTGKPIQLNIKLAPGRRRRRSTPGNNKQLVGWGQLLLAPLPD